MQSIIFSRHFWIIAALTVIIGLGYYGEHIGLENWAPFGRKFFSSEYTHDVHRALFLLPMFYAAAVYRLTGALVLSAIVLAVLIPRGVLGSENPDPLLRALLFAFIGSAAAVALGMERERSHRLVGEMARRQQAEDERSRLASIVESSEDAIIGKALDGVITSWNVGAEHLYGYTRDEVIGLHVSMLASPDAPDDIGRILDEISRGQTVRRFETVRKRKDGTQVHVSLTVSPIRDESGRVIGASTIARDITERHKAEDALRTSEERYRVLFDNTSDGIILRHLEGNISIANRAMASLTGYSAKELSTMNISSLLSPDGFETVMGKQRALFDREGESSSERYELRLLRKDGTERIVEAVTTLLRGDRGVVNVLATVRDVTEQRRARDNMRAYAAQITRAQEEERKRIARELHDETIQDLASLGLSIDSLAVTAGDLPGDMVQKLERLREKTDAMLRGMRRFSQDLRPPMIDTLGLVDSLQWLVDDLKAQQDIDASLEVRGPEHRFSADAELALFRIAQEALTNVRKHSGATGVRVTLEFESGRIRMRVIDNGSGFSVPDAGGGAAQSGKLGLIGMQERARLLNGVLTIESEAGKGTAVSVEVEG